MKVVIVGGVAGGATAAARIRRLDENAEIVVFERSGYISYANCGLPYYIGDIAVIIGKSGTQEITADALAQQCATISNETLTRLGARLERFMLPR